jgi:type II secretory pathway predicted ATPase ExeA
MTRPSREQTPVTPPAQPNPAPFPYRDYVAAREEIQSALGGKPVYVELTGASGTGKSSLLRELADGLDPHHFRPVYVSSSGTSLTNVARFIARTVRVLPKRTHLETVQSLLEVLTTQPATLVVFVDEADRVEPKALHELRVLAECHRPGQQLFSVVLSGLPVLREALGSETLFPLKRRIAVRTALRGLLRGELLPFLRHRFGADADRIPDESLDALFERTRSIPGVLDQVVRHALRARPGDLQVDDIDASLDLLV